MDCILTDLEGLSSVGGLEFKVNTPLDGWDDEGLSSIGSCEAIATFFLGGRLLGVLRCGKT